MPFKTQPTLPPNPSVRIFFIGLNILTPGDNDTCQTFVHNASQLHNLSIEVRRKRPGPPNKPDKPDVLMMRQLGPLFFTGADPSHTQGFIIQTDGLQPADKGVRAYDGTEASDEGTKLSDAFKLTDHLTTVPVVNKFGGLPGILVDHGVLYTADKVTVKARLVPNSGAPVELTEVPTIIGANIYLDPSVPAHRVTLFWRQHGKDVHLTLKPSANFTYEIYVINEPLFEEDSPGPPTHGEFAEYFKILSNVNEAEKFELEFLEEIPDRGSSRAPCMSILLGP
jgi:hypothetical protein